MLFHMMIYARTGGPPILAALNDVAPISGCVRWKDTHENPEYDRLVDFLASEGARDLVAAMESHLAVDEAMHGPQSPIYAHMLDIANMLDIWHTQGHSFGSPDRAGDLILTQEEGHGKLAELVVETSLDGIVAERDSAVFNLIERSQQDLDVERISLLFARFFHRERQSFRRCFTLLRSRSPHDMSSIDGLARSFLSIYEDALVNLAKLVPPEPSAPFYQYMRFWFTDPDRMEILRELERRAKADLTEGYETLRGLDFGHST
jgi:hypothetical protein